LVVLVGIGASAGGLEALFEFFAALPHIPGATFVVVVHQDPARPSQLPQLLRPRTRYPVSLVEAGKRVEAEQIYVAPPGEAVGIADGIFTLTPFAGWTERARRIDSFFHSAAAAFGHRTVGIVLSGSGCDGSEGVRAIAAARGLAIAQDPSSAPHGSMPSSAIATGVIQSVVRPGRMPAALLAHLERDGDDRPLGAARTA
jgi:two-component system CheB/CheR fusion protein